MNYLLIANICESSGFLKAIELVIKVIKLAMVALPLIVTVVGTINIGKAVIFGDRQKVIDELVITFKRLVFVAIVFFIPFFGKAFISVLEDVSAPITKSYNTCIENTNNIEYYEKLEEIEREEADAKRKKDIEEGKEAIKNRVVEVVRHSTTSMTTTGGNFMGQKYNLTEAQLKSIAYLAQREQGSAAGAAAEASLMANRFELYGSKFGTGGTGLYNYVRDSKWFANSKSFMAQGNNVKPDVLASVKQVLVLGNRTLPLYVDEHDCIKCGKSYDINKIVVNGRTITSHSELTNRSNYIQAQTIIHNRYGAKYTFWSFPTPTSDPFGYTDRAYNKVKGTVGAGTVNPTIS